MPGMKPTGTKTERRTSVIEITGAVIWAIALRTASRGCNSGLSSMTRCTFSTTTIASSTTSPTARSSANSDTVLAETPRM